jgi:hypothetical protein
VRARAFVVAALGACALVACGGASREVAPPAHEATAARAATTEIAPPPWPDTAFQSDDARGSRASAGDDALPRAESHYDTRRIGADEPPVKRFTGAPIDLDVKNADVQEVFRFLADVGHVNIVVASEVQGSVTLRLRHVPWDQALDVVVRVRGLALERDGNIFLVTASHASGSPTGEKSATAR